MLIVSDGTGLIGADSYITLADARIYANNYGYVLPVDDVEAEVTLRKGALYTDLFDSSYAGYRLNANQSRSYPRVDSFRSVGQNESSIETDEIPVEIKEAQVIAAHYININSAVRANDDGLALASKEVVGAVKVSYFDNGKTGKSVEITECVDRLSNLLVEGSALTMKTLRV